MQTVRTFETDNNTYYIGYGKTAKTSYEQQQERKAEIKYMIQKALMILGLTIVCVLFSCLSLELLIPMVIAWLLGTMAILTNNI